MFLRKSILSTLKNGRSLYFFSKNNTAGHFMRRTAKQSVICVRCYSEKVSKKDNFAPREEWIWTIPEGHDTGIKLKNSYYRERKNFVPFVVRDPTYVTWYACGPTVYDSSHIGHASTYLHFDMIRRVLTNCYGLNICMVMGITNMDNKIINRAILHERDFMEVADTYELEFKQDMASLNIQPPTSYIRVTDIIPQIIEYIQSIIDKNQAYASEKGNVYFSYSDAHQSVAKLYKEFYEPDVSAGGDKKFVKDICLWKAAQPGEPYWDAPWGKGRPGWHIECSVMASMCFGEKVNIHTGANDLQFPHHEYEVAQCDAYYGCQQWVDYFLHTGNMALPDGEKMSKSLGNMITIRECLKEFEERDFLRMMCCRVNWSSNFVFKQTLIDRILNTIKSLRDFFTFCDEIMAGQLHVEVDKPAIIEALDACDKAVMTYFEGNFAFSSAMNQIVKFTGKVQNATKNSETNFTDISAILKSANFVETFLNNLGFTFHHRTTTRRTDR